MSAAVADLCAAVRLPLDGASMAAMSAMLGELLPLDAGQAAAVRRMLRRHDGDPAAARVAARAAAAGLDPEGAEAERVLSILDSSDGDESPGEGGHGRREGESEPRRGDAETGLRHGAKHDDTVDIVTLEAGLRAAVGRSVLDPDVAALAVPGKDGGGWICLPFEVPFGGVDFSGFIRIWYYLGRRTAGRLVADIRCGGLRSMLEIGGEADTRTIRYCADDATERAKFAEAFGIFGAVTTASLDDGDLAELAGLPRVETDA